MMKRIWQEFSVLALLVVPLAAACASEDSDNAAPSSGSDSVVGRWEGNLDYQIQNEEPEFLSAGYRARGDFWFTIATDGSVDGRAVVTYEPDVDLSAVNAKIAYTRDAAAALAGMSSPLFGGLTGAGLAQAQGIRVEVPPRIVMEGRISGVQQGQKLRLEWHEDVETKALPMKFYWLLPTTDPGQQPIATADFPLHSPWPGKGTLEQSPHGPLEVVVVHSAESDGEGSLSSKEVATWNAHPAD